MAPRGVGVLRSDDAVSPAPVLVTRTLRKPRRRMTTRKTRVRAHVIADMSLHHLACMIVSATYAVEPTRTDYGYDLSVFTFDELGLYENGNFFIQLKATDRLKLDKRTHEARVRITRRDILTWESEPFPVYLVVFDARAEQAYSVYLQRYLAEAGISSATVTGQTIEIRLPRQKVDVTTVRDWRDDKNAVLMQMGAVTHV